MTDPGDILRALRDNEQKKPMNLVLLEYEDSEKKNFFISDLIAELESDNFLPFYFKIPDMTARYGEGDGIYFAEILETIENEQFGSSETNANQMEICDDQVSDEEGQRAIEGMTKMFTELFPKILQTIDYEEEGLLDDEEDVSSDGSRINIRNEDKEIREESDENIMEIDWVEAKTTEESEIDESEGTQMDQEGISTGNLNSDTDHDAQEILFEEDMSMEADALNEALNGIIKGLGPQLGGVFGSLKSTLDGMEDSLKQMEEEIKELEEDEVEEMVGKDDLEELPEFPAGQANQVNPFDLLGQLFGSMGNLPQKAVEASDKSSEKEREPTNNAIKPAIKQEVPKEILIEQIMDKLGILGAELSPLILVLDDIQKENQLFYEILDRIIEKRGDLNIKIIGIHPAGSIQMRNDKYRFNKNLRLLSTRLRIDNIGKKIKI